MPATPSRELKLDHGSGIEPLCARFRGARGYQQPTRELKWQSRNELHATLQFWRLLPRSGDGSREWRKVKDSNSRGSSPRPGFQDQLPAFPAAPSEIGGGSWIRTNATSLEIGGLANRWYKPLTHTSVLGACRGNRTHHGHRAAGLKARYRAIRCRMRKSQCFPGSIGDWCLTPDLHGTPLRYEGSALAI